MAREPYILVVDDDPMLLDLIVTKLEGAGYKVTSATDAWQGVVQVQGVKVGLIVTDIMMPGGGSGIDAYKKIRALPKVSPQLPVIFMTALKLDDVKKTMPEDPCVRFVSKPVDFALLQRYIKELTGSDRPLS